MGVAKAYYAKLYGQENFDYICERMRTGQRNLTDEELKELEVV